jgi:hypothetical protein
VNQTMSSPPRVAGGMFPIGLRRQRLLNKLTHSSASILTPSKLRQGLNFKGTFSLATAERCCASSSTLPATGRAAMSRQ